MVESCRVVFFSFVEVQYLSEAIVCFTHWGRLMHICVGNLAIIGSDNGFSPYRRHAIICTNDGILLIGPLGTNFSGILIEIHIFLFRKLSSGKWRSFCLGLNVLSCGKSIASTSNHSMSLQWRHNRRDSVSKYQPHGYLLGRLFRRRSKKTSKLRATGLCAGNSPGTDKFPAQMASNAETVSIWWRRHVIIDPSTNLNRLTLYVLNFSEGTNIYLHFMSFLHIDMTEAVEIISQIRPELAYSTYQYHGLWCPGDARNHAITNHDIYYIELNWLGPRTLYPTPN